jgi:GT2 family glycosyltransferase
MKNTNKKVTIIVLNYNGYQDTLDCVVSLLKVNYPLLDIVIVDNDSTDNSIQMFINYFQEQSIEYEYQNSGNSKNRNRSVKIIGSGFNGGYGFGNNIGIKHAITNGADYVLVLNNDTIVEPDFLSPLISSAETDSSIGIVSSKILYHHDKTKIWFNGGSYSPLSAKIEHINFNETDCGQNTSIDINFISGCLWLIPVKIFDAVGLINDSYFMYMEDLEFCQRVLSKGFKLKVNSNSIIYHKVGVSSGGQFSKFSISYRVRNYFIFCFEHFDSKLFCLFSITLFSLRQIGRLIKSKNINLIPTVFSSLQEGYRKIQHSLNNAEQK